MFGRPAYVLAVARALPASLYTVCTCWSGFVAFELKVLYQNCPGQHLPRYSPTLLTLHWRHPVRRLVTPEEVAAI